jgi:hypothetical protein
MGLTVVEKEMGMDEVKIEVLSRFDLRDLFAMAAMQGDIACQDDVNYEIYGVETTVEDFLPRAQMYYCMADAMLKARAS